MNDRNASVQGQGSSIQDDVPAGERQRRTIPGTDIQTEEESGVAFAEANGGGDKPPSSDDARPDPTLNADRRKPDGDGVSDLSRGGESQGGESGGAPYPNPHHGKKGGAFGTFMGHGGQSDIAYHGKGHLGEDDVDDSDNRNGVAEKD